MKNIIRNKKGIQLSEAMPSVLTLMLVALLVIVSLVIFSSLHTATVVKDTAGTAVNESVSVPTTAGVYLGANSRESAVCGAITACYNGTSGVDIKANMTQTNCLIVNSSTTTGYTTWKCSYPYTYSAATGASNASDSTITSFATYPALIGLVGTIIFLALVIGVLVASFAYGRKQGA